LERTPSYEVDGPVVNQGNLQICGTWCFMAMTFETGHGSDYVE